MTDVLRLAALIFFAAAWTMLILHWRRKAEAFWFSALTTAGDALLAVANILDRNQIWSLIFTATTVIMALATRHDWRKRKRRGRLAAIGHKSRARIAAMTARMRERPARPVLRPVPAGAR